MVCHLTVVSPIAVPGTLSHSLVRAVLLRTGRGAWGPPISGYFPPLLPSPLPSNPRLPPCPGLQRREFFPHVLGHLPHGSSPRRPSSEQTVSSSVHQWPGNCLWSCLGPSPLHGDGQATHECIWSGLQKPCVFTAWDLRQELLCKSRHISQVSCNLNMRASLRLLFQKVECQTHFSWNFKEKIQWKFYLELILNPEY